MKWFISDLHLDHEKLLLYRQKTMGLPCFESLEIWQDFILNKIMEVTEPYDIIYHLGDFAFKSKNMAKFRQRIKKRQQFLIRGNHDPSNGVCATIFGKGMVHELHETKLLKDRVTLCHYPMAFWPASHHGSFLLYGHCHGKRESTLNTWMPDRRSMDISPEVIYKTIGEIRPMNEVELHELLSKKTGHDPVSWYIDNFGPLETE